MKAKRIVWVIERSGGSDNEAWYPFSWQFTRKAARYKLHDYKQMYVAVCKWRIVKYVPEVKFHSSIMDGEPFDPSALYKHEGCYNGYCEKGKTDGSF